MSIDGLNFWMGFLSLLISFVAGYKQLKTAFLKLLRIGGGAARHLASRDDARTALFLDYPSALVAYALRTFVFLVLIYLALQLAKLAPQAGLIGSDHWLRTLGVIVLPAIAGGSLGLMASRCSSVLTLAKARREAATD